MFNTLSTCMLFHYLVKTQQNKQMSKPQRVRAWRQQWGNTISTQQRKFQRVIFFTDGMEGDARFTDDRSCPSISRHPQLLPRLGKWPSKSKKLTMSILAGAVNSDIVGTTSIYGFISVKTHCAGWNRAVPQGKRAGGEEGDLGDVTLCQEVTDPGPFGTAAGALRAAPLELQNSIYWGNNLSSPG